MFNCYFKSSKEKKSFYQHKKLEMLNYIKDSLERKIASVTASIEVLENQISRDKEVEVTNQYSNKTFQEFFRAKLL